ncbi:hypothetical protein ACA910_011582 [Epithemia clementina (nom. ined.)]
MLHCRGDPHPIQTPLDLEHAKSDLLILDQNNLKYHHHHPHSPTSPHVDTSSTTKPLEGESNQCASSIPSVTAASSSTSTPSSSSTSSSSSVSNNNNNNNNNKKKKTLTINEAKNEYYDSYLNEYLDDERDDHPKNAALKNDIWYNQAELSRFLYQYEMARHALFQVVPSYYTDQWRHVVSTLYKSSSHTASSSSHYPTNYHHHTMEDEGGAWKLALVYLEDYTNGELVGIEHHLLSPQCRMEGLVRRRALCRAVFQEQPYSSLTMPSSSFGHTRNQNNNNGKDDPRQNPSSSQSFSSSLTPSVISRRFSQPAEQFAHQKARALSLSLMATEANEYSDDDDDAAREEARGRDAFVLSAAAAATPLRLV